MEIRTKSIDKALAKFRSVHPDHRIACYRLFKGMCVFTAFAPGEDPSKTTVFDPYYAVDLETLELTNFLPIQHDGKAFFDTPARTLKQ